MHKPITVKCNVDDEMDLAITACHLTVRIPGKITLEFFCPFCYKLQIKEVSVQICQQLTDLGVAADALLVPDEFFEQKKGDPICEAEISELCAEMERPSFQIPLAGKKLQKS